MVMRIWKIFLMHMEKDWKRYMDEKSVFIGEFGPKEMNEVDKYTCKEDMMQFVSEGAAAQLWAFSNEMKKNDIVVAYSPRRILGVGKIMGDYEFEPILDTIDQCYHKSHIRGVKWAEFKPHLDASSDNALFCEPPQAHEALNDQVKISEIGPEEWKKIFGQYPGIKERYQELSKKPTKAKKTKSGKTKKR